MLKVGDLRIGNAFLQKGSNFVEFATVGDLVRIHEGSIIAEPIPLTEELAFRLGFENRIVDKWLVLKFAGLVIYFDGQILQIEKQGSLGCVIYRKYDDNYLHDLQNLIYALTKKELPCN